MTSADLIYRQHRRPLLGFIRQRVGDPGVAEDILHEVFVRVLARLDALRAEEKLVAWLYQIARNAIVDHWRGTHASEALPDELADTAEPPAPAERLAECLRPMVQELPEPYREAVTLFEFEGYSLQQIAERMGISLSGAKSRVQRGRARLEIRLHECCEIELSRTGSVIDYHPRRAHERLCSSPMEPSPP